MASLNRSSRLKKQLSKAAGEAIVTYKLSRQGWLVVNANSGIQNISNLDLIAMKGKKRITIQVKAARDKKHIQLAGKFKSDGRYFNTKED
jgi:Holliday junction resolvase